MSHTLKITAAPTRWQNLLPDWLNRSSPSCPKMTPGAAMTLQALANAGERDAETGHIVNIWGTARVRRASGVSRASFWRHVKRLEELGALVVLARGGVLGAGQDVRGKRNVANTYGIPGQPGGLDHLAVARRKQRMVAEVRQQDGEAVTVFVPEVFESGEQATIWRNPDKGGPRPSPGYAGTCSAAGGSIKPIRGSSQSETPLSPLPSPGKSKTYRARKSRPGAGKLPHLHPRDLRDTQRLVELTALYQEAWPLHFARLPSPVLSVVTMAEHVLAKDPLGCCALFVSNISAGRWGVAGDKAEQRAQSRLSELRRQSSGTSEPEPSEPAGAAQGDSWGDLSEDAKTAAAAAHAKARAGLRCSVFRALQRAAGWSRDRFDAAAAELTASGVLNSAALAALGDNA